jgi:hypothetical protein
MIQATFAWSARRRRPKINRPGGCRNRTAALSSIYSILAREQFAGVIERLEALIGIAFIHFFPGAGDVSLDQSFDHRFAMKRGRAPADLDLTFIAGIEIAAPTLRRGTGERDQDQDKSETAHGWVPFISSEATDAPPTAALSVYNHIYR